MTLEAAPEVECLCHDALFSSGVNPVRKRKLTGAAEALRPPAAANEHSGLTSLQKGQLRRMMWDPSSFLCEPTSVLGL
jgi:hypothetical protein